MGTLSVSVPKDLKDKMKELDEINWSAVARKAFEEKIRQVEFLKKIAGKSELTENDAEEISKKINENVAERFRRL